MIGIHLFHSMILARSPSDIAIERDPVITPLMIIIAETYTPLTAFYGNNSGSLEIFAIGYCTIAMCCRFMNHWLIG